MALTTPNTQLFLNELDDEDVKLFIADVYASGDYQYIVNHRHIYAPIHMTELATMKSLRSESGELYFD